ncbi:general stress protein [Paenibacillus sp. NEAU-GSW1]|uniref:general stress protein n=1 Tax=Paenibacillus sp. NEAU-GSW1 TaxID=2682486 RepID=UPI0012E29EEE|nr:general stress protein [Paenibacillus sp. NEAU-GSW1]MUT68448.1 hypothetical protein [Paenibacillus sp. NEAU-GSW1]
MAKEFASFQSEQQVIDTVAALLNAGFEKGDLKVLSKDASHSRRIEMESDMHVDEIMELAETREHTDHNLGDAAWAYPALIAGGSLSGTTGWNAAPFAAVFAGGGFTDDDAGMTNALQAMGLDSNEADFCSEALRNGHAIVVVETDDSKALLDKDGGPDLSRLGVAEAVFRQNSAHRIISGS